MGDLIGRYAFINCAIYLVRRGRPVSILYVGGTLEFMLGGYMGDLIGRYVYQQYYIYRVRRGRSVSILCVGGALYLSCA